MSHEIAVRQDKDIQIAQQLGIDIDIYACLRYSLFPDKKIPDAAFGMYMAYCRAKNYDPIKKPIHITMMNRNIASRGQEPVWESNPVILPGIISYRIDAQRTGTFYGISDAEFGPMITEKLGQKNVTYPEWCRIVIYKKIGDEIREIPAKLYWKECYVTKDKNTEEPNDMWMKRKRAQLEKCCESLAYRKGFPEEVGALPTMDEMEGRREMDELPGEKDITPTEKLLEGTPLSKSFTMETDLLNKHLDIINNCMDKQLLRIAYDAAKLDAAGDKTASNEISLKTKDRQDYLNQLATNVKKTETAAEKEDTWGDEYDKHEVTA